MITTKSRNLLLMTGYLIERKMSKMSTTVKQMIKIFQSTVLVLNSISDCDQCHTNLPTRKSQVNFYFGVTDIAKQNFTKRTMKHNDESMIEGNDCIL